MYTDIDAPESTDTVSEPTASYGLEGIILHNSFDQVKGRTIRIDCRERTHIGGANGAGKTSTLSLIPAFFGEEPERIVSRNSGRLSFVDYYLPNQQSLLIFEYRRYSGLCCSVMYRHHSGKLCYRFVEGGAKDTFFAPGTHELLMAGGTNQEVFDHLRGNGASMSPMIDTITDYRAIIQNNPKLLRRQPAEARRLRGLAADYSLGGRDTQMSHIDRLTHVVLNRSRLLSSFKTMICETQFENIHLQTRPKPIDEMGLVQDIKSLKAFEKEEASIRDCLKQNAERLGILERARVTAGDLVATIEESREKKTEWLGAAQKVRQSAQEMDDAFSEAASARTQEIQEKSHKLTVLKKDLDGIYENRDDYEDKGLPKLSQDLDNLPEYERSHRDAQGDLNRVTSKVQALQNEHDRDVGVIKNRFQEEQEKRNNRVRDEKAALASAKHDFDKDLSAINAQQVKQEGALKEARANERAKLTNRLVREETLRDSTGQTPEESQRITGAEAAVRKAEAEARKAEDDLGQENAKCEQARQDRNTAQEILQKAEDSLNDLRAAASDLKRQITPDTGSWLSQLRQHDPEWGERLAKIINPKLLERTDLQPERHGGYRPDLVMGWSLALDNLPVPDFAANEDELQARLKALDEQIASAVAHRSQAEKSAQDRNATYTDRQRAVAHRITEKKLTDDLLERARNHQDTARREIELAIADRKQAHERQVRQLNEQIGQFDEQTREMLKALADDFSQRTVYRKAEWAETSAEIEESIQNAIKLAENAQTEHEHRLETMKVAYDQRLQENDIDPSIVRELRNKVDELQRTIEGIRDHESVIREYKAWLKKDWARVKELTDDVTALGSEVESLGKAHEKLQKDHREAIKVKTNEAKQLEDKAKTLNQQIDQADHTIRKFRAGCEQPAANGFPKDLITLTSDLQDDCRRLDRLRGDVLKAFTRAQGVLNNYSGTQIYQSWQKHLQYRRGTLSDPAMEYDDAFKLEQLQDLRLLLDTDVPHLRSAVIEQFAAHAGSLKDYFDGLESMAREVKRVSNQLRRKINTDQQIESISDIRVELQARIEDDDSWRPLKAFVSQWGDWHPLNPRKMPADSIVTAFQRVTDTLKSASVGQNIESMIDMKLVMKENDREVPIRNDNDFLNASSEGLTYLAIMAVFMGMTRYLCPDLNTRITWPVDEIGKLDPTNISRLASMLERNNLTMISACPELNRPLEQFFENKISIKAGQIHSFEKPEATNDYRALLAGVIKHKTVTRGEEASNVG